MPSSRIEVDDANSVKNKKRLLSLRSGSNLIRARAILDVKYFNELQSSVKWLNTLRSHSLN